jgi:RNA ligase (TIGR02306 family)
MSKLIVEVVKIKSIDLHPHADRLEILSFVNNSWTTIVKKDQFKIGNLLIFIPPDSILTERLHTQLGITNYCGELPKGTEWNTKNCRKVKATRLRGVASYGTVCSLIDVQTYVGHRCAFYEGYDVAHLLDIEKWEPPIKSIVGDAERDSPQFHKYTDIENIKNYPNVFNKDDVIVITQKIHGQNFRVGYCLDTIDNQWKFMVGSHNCRKKEFDKDGNKSSFWHPLDWYPQIKDVLLTLHKASEEPVIMFGEIFGWGVQDLHYGLPLNKKDMRIFDISIGGKYMDFHPAFEICKSNNIPYVPVEYVGLYSDQIVEDFTNGSAFAYSDNDVFKQKEGVCIKTIIEQDRCPVGRLIMKSVSVDYLNRRNPVDN